MFNHVSSHLAQDQAQDLATSAKHVFIARKVVIAGNGWTGY